MSDYSEFYNPQAKDLPPVHLAPGRPLQIFREPSMNRQARTLLLSSINIAALATIAAMPSGLYPVSIALLVTSSGLSLALFKSASNMQYTETLRLTDDTLVIERNRPKNGNPDITELNRAWLKACVSDAPYHALELRRHGQVVTTIAGFLPVPERRILAAGINDALSRHHS